VGGFPQGQPSGGGRESGRKAEYGRYGMGLGLNAEGPGGEGMGRLAWEGDGWGVGYGTEPLEDALGEDIQIAGRKTAAAGGNAAALL